MKGYTSDLEIAQPTKYRQSATQEEEKKILYKINYKLLYFVYLIFFASSASSLQTRHQFMTKKVSLFDLFHEYLSNFIFITKHRTSK